MELIDLGKLPIAGNNAAGSDVRNEDIYDLLSSEINKRASVTANDVVDWVKVVRLSQEILENHSKDILVCSYLCVGLLNVEGLKGLATGIHIYNDLLTTYWANLFPPRINGRLNALDWWLNTVNEQLRKTAREVWSDIELEQLNQDFEALLKFFTDNDIDKFAETRSMFNACKALISNTPAPAVLTPEPEALPATPPTNVVEEPSPLPQVANVIPDAPSVVAAPTPAIVVEAISLPDAINLDNIKPALDPIFNALSKVADVLYEQHPSSYLLFRINRFNAWLTLNQLPPHDNDAKTLLPPPDKLQVDFVNKFYQEKSWLNLLKYAEARIVQHRFWLDLSFYAYTALMNLNYLESAAEVASETLMLTKRLNGIEKLAFSDGTPFASMETLEWIAGLSGSGSTENNLISDNEEWTKEVAQAKQLVDKGDLSSAINKLNYKIQTAVTKRDRFMRMLFFCQFIINSTKQPQLAKPYLSELLNIAKLYQLDTWEPSLVSEAYQLILSTHRQKRIRFDDNEVNEVLSRLTMIDPVSAIKFNNR